MFAVRGVYGPFGGFGLFDVRDVPGLHERCRERREPLSGTCMHTPLRELSPSPSAERRERGKDERDCPQR